MLPEHTRYDIGSRIRDFRIDNRYSQLDFSEGIDISVNFLSEIENGKKGFSYETLYNMCKRYNISSDYILFGKKEEPKRSDYITDIADKMTIEELEVLINYLISLKSLKKL
ncbi:MAG: helix-turn-helix domain-containing protein [Wujia sp.]